MMAEARTRLGLIREILEGERIGSQDELADALRRRGHDVNQSTISRSLRKLGAIKTLDESGQTVYQLPREAPLPAPVQASLADLVLDISSNGSMIVIHTPPGSASLVARHLDHNRPASILGTIAGDDTIFVAPSAAKPDVIRGTIEGIRQDLLNAGRA